MLPIRMRRSKGNRSKIMLSHSNLEDYTDPRLFDLENDDFEPDGPFYLALAQKINGSVLELGCGTGRLTIPLARHGIDITGLDIVPEMLNRAQSKAGDQQIPWVEGDVRDFHLGRKFNLICAPGCVFEHLLNHKDQKVMLACVRKHLTSEGIFVIAVRVPQPGMMIDTDEQEWFSYQDEDGREVHVSGTDHYDPLQQIRHETAYRRWYNTDGKEIISRARLALRLIFPQEMEMLLHYNGFVVLHRWGDWNSNSPTNESHLIIYECQKMR